MKAESYWDYNEFIKSEDIWDAFAKRLKSWDYYYAMSDDHRVWSTWEGRKHVFQSMKNHMLELDAERARKMIDNSLPWNRK